MNESYEFLSQVLDSITEHIVVIDPKGQILFVNQRWNTFGNNNACLIGENWKGVNYLEECDKAAAMGDDFGTQVATGIREVIHGRKQSFYFEYPCHSPEERRWFMMRVTPFRNNGTPCFVISHQNITERKLAEETVRNLSRLDGLTNIPNRRTFDEFLHDEWSRCTRLGMPLSLAIIDIDHFKLLNDTYGHQAGDDCLRKVSQILQRYAKRPSDICARYGGEEFALVYGNTPLELSKVLLNRLQHEIRMLNIPNENAPTHATLTTSIGLAEMYPEKISTEDALIKKADELLYAAKENGRNTLRF